MLHMKKKNFFKEKKWKVTLSLASWWTSKRATKRNFKIEYKDSVLSTVLLLFLGKLAQYTLSPSPSQSYIETQMCYFLFSQIDRLFDSITDPSYKTLASLGTFSNSFSNSFCLKQCLQWNILTVQATSTNAIKRILQYLFLCAYVLSMTFIINIVCETVNSYRKIDHFSILSKNLIL